MRRILVLAAGSLALYRYRYKIVNIILGQPALRRYFIQLSMRVPFLKELFINRAFH
ncbi:MULTISPECIES: hypothetical protein [Metabacillus]|jgi:hypothetical protein|uniref:Uncharacterized protein n=1 Tax=Metabacillus rhizolycopersici TaxID=2875709 RepID=A0ABS7UP81_9BACI|nr:MULTISPECIES: hypothetical protein [Metabacillus]MBZ5749739.1 hypothetical protein [Metabacillus rhizolycopersici]MCM3650464.1 hypothetical protein [Metabacillus litoralis]